MAESVLPLVAPKADEVAIYRELIKLSEGLVDGHDIDDIVAVDLSIPSQQSWMSLNGEFEKGSILFLHRASLAGGFKLSISSKFQQGKIRNARILIGKTKGSLILQFTGHDGTVVIGDCGPPFFFDARVSVRGNLIIGDGTTIGKATAMVGRSFLSIGRDCLLSSGLSLISAVDHAVINCEGRPLALPQKLSGIRIGDHVWLGYNSHVVGTAKIGDGSIVAAHSVVASEVASNTLVAGNPVKAKKKEVTWSRFAESLDPATKAYLETLAAVNSAASLGIVGAATNEELK